MKNGRKLSVQLFVPIMAVFLGLWLLIMGIIDRQTVELTQLHVAQTESEACRAIEELWPKYAAISQEVPEANAHLTYTLGEKSKAMAALGGAMVLGVRNEQGAVLTTPLVMGVGRENRDAPEWFFFLGAESEDDILLPLMQRLYREDNPYRSMGLLIDGKDGNVPLNEDNIQFNGCSARVTGAEQEGNVLAVAQITLIFPDGTEEVILDTGNRSENLITKEFQYLHVESPIMDTTNHWGTTNKRQEKNELEFRLDQFRRAHRDVTRCLEPGRTDYYYLFPGEEDTAAGYCIGIEQPTRSFIKKQNDPIRYDSLLVAVLAAMALSLALSFTVKEPVHKLCRQVKKGVCSEEGPIRELNELAVSFNEQQRKMEEQLQRERDFTRAAAHELKTPLAVMRAHTEALYEDVLPENREEYFNVVLEETDRMTGQVSRLLELSRLETGCAVLHEQINFTELVRKVFQPLELPMKRKNMKLDLNLQEVFLEGDSARLKDAVENLASNALRYGSRDGTVRVDLEATKQEIRLSVTNDAPPIPEKDIPRLFEPFYRVDKARSRADCGTGLGLAIVKASVEAHGGSCSAENLPGAVRFTLKLPVQK